MSGAHYLHGIKEELNSVSNKRQSLALAMKG